MSRTLFDDESLGALIGGNNSTAGRILPVMMKLWLLGPILFVGLPDAPAPLGIWKGQSLCTVKPSACHDENVVYHCSEGKAPGRLVLQANKIVDGKELDMGTLECTWDAPKRSLTCPTPNRG